MEQVWRYRFSRRMWLISMGQILIFALLAVGLFYLYEGEYFSAWFTSCVVALLLLLFLSVPRKIRLSPQRLRIDCLMDMTEIPVAEIASVRRVEPREMRAVIPLFGGCGFFGFYGHYLDVVQVERVRLYASEWRNFVEITDIYEERYIVSCSAPDELKAQIEKLISTAPDAVE